MDKATVYKDWIEATAEAIEALQDWRSQLADWQARGGEAMPGDFDVVFRATANNGGLEGWLDQCTAGGGIDLLAAIVKGGDVCPTCGGTGKVRYSFLPESCPTCGGVGAVEAGETATGPVVDTLRKALAFVQEQGRFVVHVWWKNAQHLNETGRVLAWGGGPELLALTDLLTGERKTVKLADVFDVEVGE